MIKENLKFISFFYISEKYEMQLIDFELLKKEEFHGCKSDEGYIFNE